MLRCERPVPGALTHGPSGRHTVRAALRGRWPRHACLDGHDAAGSSRHDEMAAGRCHCLRWRLQDPAWRRQHHLSRVGRVRVSVCRPRLSIPPCCDQRHGRQHRFFSARPRQPACGRRGFRPANRCLGQSRQPGRGRYRSQPSLGYDALQADLRAGFRCRWRYRYLGGMAKVGRRNKCVGGVGAGHAVAGQPCLAGRANSLRGQERHAWGVAVRRPLESGQHAAAIPYRRRGHRKTEFSGVDWPLISAGWYRPFGVGSTHHARVATVRCHATRTRPVSRCNRRPCRRSDSLQHGARFDNSGDRNADADS